MPDGLVDGMTADTNVTIASRRAYYACRAAWCMPLQTTRSFGRYGTATESQNRQVTIGLRGDSNVEIVSGLKEGTGSREMKIIQTENLTRTYAVGNSTVKALRGVNLEVEGGRVRGADGSLGQRQVHDDASAGLPGHAHRRDATCWKGAT